jgi:hypothetical protein
VVVEGKIQVGKLRGDRGRGVRLIVEDWVLCSSPKKTRGR